MTDTVTNELIFEVLRKIQADVSHIRARVDDHDRQFISLRQQNVLVQSEQLRIEGEMLERFSRIERRLELTDA
jgi:hypothetical protein